jgi:hypothetical protein
MEVFMQTEHQAELFEGHVEEYVSILGNKVLGYYETMQEGIGVTAQYPGAKLFHRCRLAGEEDDLGAMSIEPDARTISMPAISQDAMARTVLRYMDNGVPESRISTEHQYYFAHQAELVEGHIDEYVSILGNEVVGYYKTRDEGESATIKQYPGRKAYFIHRCRPVGDRDDLDLISSEGIKVRRTSLPSDNQELKQGSCYVDGYISIVARQVPISTELKYYLAYQAELVEGHIDEYVSIMETKVLGYYKTQDEGLHATMQQYPLQKAYFVHRCSPVGGKDDLDWIRSENIKVRRA